MTSRDLVGRPLVPFFDCDENVNDSLQLGDDEKEEMDVDARVWDKELGYFVYPSEQQATVSKPVAIVTTTDSGKLLLTPSMMLSTSAPEGFNSMAANGNPVQATTDGAQARSSSAKRGSKQKSRPNTPGRRQKDKEGGENVNSSKKSKNKGGNANSNGAQFTSNQQPRNGKQKEQLSASGKWAWSAFQSSPDPTQLPMPSFLTKPSGGLGLAPAPPLPPTPPPAQYANVPMAPPLPPGPPPSQPPLPLQPPLPPMPVPPEMTAPAPMSVELSMTQDLRRMLNIGGG